MSLVISSELGQCEEEFVEGIVSMADAARRAYMALHTIRTKELWRQCVREDGTPAFRTFVEYLSDFIARVRATYPDLPLSWGTVWNNLWRIRALVDGLGVAPETAFSLSYQVLMEIRQLAIWDRRSGSPLGLRGDVDPKALPGEDGEPLRDRLRKAVENVAAICAEMSDADALRYLREDLRFDRRLPGQDPPVRYGIVAQNGAIKQITIRVDTDRGCIVRALRVEHDGDIPDFVIDDIKRRLR